MYIIIPIPAPVMNIDRKPSDTCVLIAWLTKTVSADNRFINSPVLLASKNAISCLTIFQNYVIISMVSFRNIKSAYNMMYDEMQVKF